MKTNIEHKHFGIVKNIHCSLIEKDEVIEAIEPNFGFIEALGYLVIIGGFFISYTLSQQLPNFSSTMLFVTTGFSLISGAVLIALGKIASELELIRETILDQIDE